MLGAYAARRCPVRTQWEEVRPCEPLPRTPLLERPLARGREFEDSIIARVLSAHPGAVVVAEGRRLERERATEAALREGAQVVIRGRLPRDLAGRRVGEPDLLVRAGRGGYRPVEVKDRMALVTESTSFGAEVSSIAHLDRDQSSHRRGQWADQNAADLIQLAHYQRMLEAVDLAPQGGRRAGIIGREGVVAWYNLDSPVWTRSQGRRGGTKFSTMDLYDAEFALRVEVLDAAVRHRSDPKVPYRVEPIRINECPRCPWWVHCGPILEAGAGSVSLVPGSKEREYTIHLAHGVRDRRQLAELDHGTAELLSSGVDLRPLLAALDRLPAATAVADVVGSRKRAQLRRLEEAGIRVLSDARRLDPATASYASDSLKALPERIDLARAALGSAPVYRRRGVERVVVPRGDVEVDVDMENAEEGVYLWGTLVSGAGGEDGYRPFQTWTRLDRASELHRFRQFWTWLQEMRQRCRDRGLSFRAYCFSAGAENGQMRRITAGTDLQVEVREFVGSGQWVDLRQVFNQQLVTGAGTGLKIVARLAGFAWEVEDPGGEESMLKYDEAVGTGPDAVAARAWLLNYNRNDVEATFRLREWLDGGAGGPPSVADLGP